MTLAVVDASVFAAFYTADDPRHALVAERLSIGDTLFAPAHVDVEIVSALRGMARGNPGLDRVAPDALVHLAGFPIRRMPLPPLLNRAWELRHHLTVYDAVYVALAERLNAVLVTCDARLVNASEPHCAVEQIA